MKKIITVLAVAAATCFMAQAQQIAVVNPDGTTELYSGLDYALISASDGSTVYLSGGGFQLHDSVRIVRKITIMGVGHRPDNDNADGNTIISGNLNFRQGSNGSTVMGVYLSGNINIGAAEESVSNILVRYCNINSIQVARANCTNIHINQNYIRGVSNCNNSPTRFTNNVLHSIQNVDGGLVDHNVIRHYHSAYGYTRALVLISNSQISNNILLDPSSIHAGDNCIVRNNMLDRDWGDASYGTIKVGRSSWEEDIFDGPITGVNPNCNYHLKGSFGKNAATDGTDVGIYGGTGFSDAALPPIPRIISKVIPEQTDENGRLRIKVHVKSK